MEHYSKNIVMPYLLVYIISIQVIATNSRTSTLWKLNIENGQIHGYGSNRYVSKDIQEIYDNDPTFEIITSTVTSSHDHGWSKQAKDLCECTAPRHDFDEIIKNLTDEEEDNEVLDCGKAVNFTYYDDLIGVAQRYNHPIVPEPEVAYQFLKNKNSKNLKNFNIDLLEKRLKKAKRERPRSVQLYNQIGNFWRIKGDARKSIDCFRRALAISPSNPEVLHNLARVLFNLQYLDDAIHLTRRSLEVQPPDRSAWRQHFTLGEIFKAYGHFQESIVHLRYALDLYPQYEPIQRALRDVENIPSSSLHVYTFLIIICLVIGVLLVILSTNDSTLSGQESMEPKNQRHFNRAMAMRSLKGITSRSGKHRKYY